jgi:hypothetical protein
MTNKRLNMRAFVARVLTILLAIALWLGAPTVEPKTALAQSAEQCAEQLTFDPKNGAFLTSDTLLLRMAGVCCDELAG